MNRQTPVGFAERELSTEDGLRLYYRDYAGPANGQTPVLCLPGLTRNSKDFHDLAMLLSADRRVICPDMRGRGNSEYDPDWRNYHPAVYVGDVRHLLASLNLHRVFVVGTSMGGILAMAMGAAFPNVLTGALLNDVGPVISLPGVDQIVSYVDSDKHYHDWDSVVEHFKTYFPNLPARREEDWLLIAEKSFRIREDGLIVEDWDSEIIRPLRKLKADELDLWPLFRSLSRLPLVAVRGVKSDILTEETFTRMAKEIPSMISVEVGDCGHAPTLAEQNVLEALDAALECADATHP